MTLLRVVEAAHMLRLQPSTIRAWILRRRLPYVKLGGRVCIRRADVEALIAQSVVQPVSNVQDGFKSAGTSPPTRADEPNADGQAGSGGGR